MHAILALLLMGPPQAAPAHDRAFWQQIVKAKFDLPW
jgi:hypothetical protein